VRDGQRSTDRSSERDALPRQTFGHDPATARTVTEALAKAYLPDGWAAQADVLAEPFRPDVPAGKQGWGTAGHPNLDARRYLQNNTGGPCVPIVWVEAPWACASIPQLRLLHVIALYAHAQAQMRPKGQRLTWAYAP
jgi:hypothetical protein